MDKNKYLIVKGLAGLGNRIMSALNGILYARLTGRKLIIDWSDRTYSNDGSNAFPNFFQCALCDPTDEIPITDSVMPVVWRGRLREFATNLRNPYRDLREFERETSIDLTKLDYEENVAVMWTFNERVEILRNHFKGAYEELSKMRKDDVLKRLLREDLILHPQIRKRINEFKSRHFFGRTVGVHIRYTDHRVNIGAILDRLDTLLRLEPNLQIFLATDNIQIKSMFEENYPGVITAPHWYPRPGYRLHDNRRCPEPFESGVEALVDLYLLSECDYLIIDTSSTFSKVANLLTTAPEPNVYDLKRGDKLTPFVRRMTWRTMLRLGFYSWGLNILSKIQRTKRFFKR